MGATPAPLSPPPPPLSGHATKKKYFFCQVPLHSLMIMGQTYKENYLIQLFQVLRLVKVTGIQLLQKTGSKKKKKKNINVPTLF